MMRPRRWLAWKFYQLAGWVLTWAARWLSWEQGPERINAIPVPSRAAPSPAKTGARP